MPELEGLLFLRGEAEITIAYKTTETTRQTAVNHTEKQHMNPLSEGHTPVFQRHLKGQYF